MMELKTLIPNPCTLCKYNQAITGCLYQSKCCDYSQVYSSMIQQRDADQKILDKLVTSLEFFTSKPSVMGMFKPEVQEQLCKTLKLEGQQ